MSLVRCCGTYEFLSYSKSPLLISWNKATTKKKKWLRPLFRPNTNHTCHQKPNLSRETVSLTAWIFICGLKSFPRVRICIRLPFQTDNPDPLQTVPEALPYPKISWHYPLKKIALESCTWRKLSICCGRDVMSGWRVLSVSVNSCAFSWSRLAALPPTLSSHSSLPNRFLQSERFLL